MITYFYSILIIFLIFILAYWYGRKTKEWKWSEYFLLTLAPFGGMTFLTWFKGHQIIIFFVLSSLAGFCGEIIMVFSQKKSLEKNYGNMKN